MAVLVIFYFLNVDLETALLIPSGAAILVYVLGSSRRDQTLERVGEKSASRDFACNFACGFALCRAAAHSELDRRGSCVCVCEIC